MEDERSSCGDIVNGTMLAKCKAHGRGNARLGASIGTRGRPQEPLQLPTVELELVVYLATSGTRMKCPAGDVGMM